MEATCDEGFIVKIVLLNVKLFERAKKIHEVESDRMAKDKKACPENQRFPNKRASKQNNEVANRQGLMKKSARGIERFPKLQAIKSKYVWGVDGFMLMHDRNQE